MQSRKDNVRIDPFNLKIVAPTKDTTTGCEERLSASGGVIIIVKTDPRLVPTHNVGISTVGSITNKFFLVKINVNN